jgi:hypothetical protein
VYDIKPHMIEKGGVGRALDPLPHKKGVFKQEEQHDEKWLQKLLFEHPDILPIDHFHKGWAPLIPIGREIENIDNLFVSPEGLITIVETKLWRNPEAHREVVAQILDYAKNLRGWDYKKLDDAVKASMARRHGQSMSIWDIVRGKKPDGEIDEQEFVQMVEDCLQQGRFALLIVGDKIRPAATELAKVIGSTPDMQYWFGFVELMFYKRDRESDWPLVVIPRLVQETREEARATVRIFYDKERPRIEVSAPDEKVTPGSTSFSEFIKVIPSEYVDLFQLYLGQWESAGYIIFWGRVGFSLRIPRTDKPTVTVFDAYPEYVGICGDKIREKYKIPEKNHEQYKSDLKASTVLTDAFSAGRKFIRFEEMEFEDVLILLKAAGRLAKDLYEANEASESGS